MILTSLSVSDVIGIIVSIILIYVAKFYFQYFTRTNPLPGSIPLPFVGNLLGIIHYGKGDFTVWYKILHERHGDIFETYIGGCRRIVIARPDYIEKIMSTSTQSTYTLRMGKTPAFDELGVSKIGLTFNTHVPNWKFNRQFFTKVILAPSFSKEVVNLIPTIYDELNEYWKEIGEDVPIDFSIWINKFTTEITFQMVVGLRVNGLKSYFNSFVESSKKKFIEPNPIDKDMEHFPQITNEGLEYLGFFLVVPAIIRHTLLKKKNDAAFENRKQTFDLLTKIINHRRKEIEQTSIHEELRYDMLTLLITTNTERELIDQKSVEEEHSKPLTNDQISQILLEALSGGIDTSSNALCTVVYYLAHYPEVLARLRQELDTIFGFEKDRKITMEDLSKMRYAEAIFYECTRFVNPAKTLLRTSTTKDIIAGYEWPANMLIEIYAEGIHMNPAYWKDPHKFNPDRFMKSEALKSKILTFGGGVRGCPGRKIALITIKLLIFLIYRNFDITLVDMNVPMNLKYSFLNTCTELKIKVRPRMS
ncbi:15407_t:CDS:1 [Funneliformis caledonium]|uniref:15407_t:CDS:1 n=1 Tax=Funneliformis caledonium TaxID=1117310 RepID=A0A9N9ATZ8_9GLOM|nr:15407_t:CDS:1 [Funneliformis caledonium]